MNAYKKEAMDYLSKQGFGMSECGDDAFSLLYPIQGKYPSLIFATFYDVGPFGRVKIELYRLNLNSVLQEKRYLAYALCNAINRKSNFINFYVDNDDDNNYKAVSNSFCTLDNVGKISHDLLSNMINILNNVYDDLKIACE